MGAKNSTLSSEQLDEYFELTYLSKFEILLVLDKLSTLRRGNDDDLMNVRFPMDDVVEVFPQLKYNPFRDRLVTVFSSAQDDCYSFEDLLDVFSVLSEKCPITVKAAWAFRLYDFDGDNLITKDDIMTLCDRITNNDRLEESEKEIVTAAILSEIDLQNNGCLGEFDFIHAMQKIPEFLLAFTCRI